MHVMIYFIRENSLILERIYSSILRREIHSLEIKYIHRVVKYIS